MARRMNVRCVAAGLLMLAAGCAAKPAASVSPSMAPDAARPTEFGSAASAESGRTLQGGRRAVIRAVQLEMYQLTVPHGAISRSEEFWKRVDEQRVDVATY